ncbi:hypothetical protein ACIRF8_04220 [Streptomyces sp. NPDC102406]|uniref:hypothetical protein n=1 Tax=Streptomyces sp. NPDC102406 TaxID=3366171 RepID=UPI003827FDE2
MDDNAREDRLLMSAITGEPLPRDDPGAAAVMADVALLREQVQGLGDALAARRDPEPLRPPAPAPVRRRRPLRLALGGLVAAGGLAVVSVMVWAVAQSGGMGADAGDSKSAADSGVPGSGGAKLSPEGVVACSRTIAEGTVVRVEPVPGTGQDRITLRVTRYYKPETGGARTLTFPMDHDAIPRLKTGDQPLVAIPVGGREPDNWAMGADRASLRAMVLKALPGSRSIPCDDGPPRNA